MRRAEEIGCVLSCGGAVMGKVAPGELQLRLPLLHGHKGRTAPEGLSLLRLVTQQPRLAQGADQSAPGIKERFLLPLGHSRPTADLFEGLPLFHALGHAV